MKQKTTELWHRFGDNLRRFILNKVKDETLADDLLQEVFIRIHSKIDNLRDEAKVQSWVFQIARNRINDHYEFDKYGTVISYHPIHCCCCN